MRVLITGSAGLIGGYLVAELLQAGYEVIGLDDHSKYGPVVGATGGRPGHRSVTGDAKDRRLLEELGSDCDQIVAGAAMVGGIGYFHAYPYDLLAENERITATAFDAALALHRRGTLRRIVLISSSMVFERTTVFPTPEGAQLDCRPPLSAYGFQKLALERFAIAAHEQYGLPYTIVRPFNCVGVGERRALRDDDAACTSGHVVTDLVAKVLHGEDPLHILGDGEQVRHYTYGGDLARGIRIAMESDAALNEDFNLATARATTVRELAELIWRKINGDRPLRVVSDRPFTHDVRVRAPDVSKARRLLRFDATTDLDTVLDEVVPWMRNEVRAGRA